MPLSPGFADFVVELLAQFGSVEVKRMFGGAAVARDGVGFGILDDDTFFIKADPEFAAELKARGARPWRYSLKKDGGVRDIGFWSLPDTAIDDPDEAADLARRSYGVAIAAAAQKKAKPPAAKTRRSQAATSSEPPPEEASPPPGRRRKPAVNPTATGRGARRR